MCARCLKEGGEVDFTSVPKRKKKGRPVMMMAYVPTAEEEQQALESDGPTDKTQVTDQSTQAQDATQSSVPLHGSVSGDAVASADEVVGVSSPVESVFISATTSSEPSESKNSIENSTLVITREDQTTAELTYSGMRVRTIKKDHRSSNSTKISLVIRCTENVKDVPEENFFEERVIKSIVEGSQVYLFEASLARLSAVDFSVSALFETVLITLQTALTAEEKPVVTLCCVGLDATVVVALWNSGEGKLSRLCVVDPPPLMEPLEVSTLTGVAHVVRRSDPRAIPSRSITKRSSSSASAATSVSPGDNSDGALNPAAWCLAEAGVRFLARLPLWTRKLPMLRVSLKAVQLVLEFLQRAAPLDSPSIPLRGRDEGGGEQICLSDHTSKNTPEPTHSAASWCELFYSSQYIFGTENDPERVTLQHSRYFDGNVANGEEGGGVTTL